MRSLLLLLVLTAAPTAEPLTVFVLIGQSNMVGKRCAIKDLPTALAGPQEHVLFFHPKAGWEPMQPGRTEASGYGPELSFGRAMADALKRPVGIIKHSKGGTNLAKQWSPTADGSHFAKTVALVAQAGEARAIRVAGVVWCHGGADAKQKEMAEAYAANLLGLIAACRRDFGNPTLAFVSSRRNVNWIPENKPFLAVVRAAQQECPAKRYAWVDTDDLTFRSDNIHFDGPGQVEAGRRYAGAMLKLLKR